MYYLLMAILRTKIYSSSAAIESRSEHPLGEAFLSLCPAKRAGYPCSERLRSGLDPRQGAVGRVDGVSPYQSAIRDSSDHYIDIGLEKTG